MDNAIYATLTRQSGLMAEMQGVANNIANAATTGFRKEGVVFAEHPAALGPAGGAAGSETLSMATAKGRAIDLSQGPLSKTGGPLDFAIEGDGFFQIETPAGPELTRAGNFALSPEGELVTADGYRLLGSGGSPISVPPGGPPALSADGTLSVNGMPVAQLGLVRPADPSQLVHRAGTRFAVDGPLEPVAEARLFQGFLESSNVSPVAEIARMIEVQRAYEMGQSFLDNEDARIRNVLQTIGK